MDKNMFSDQNSHIWFSSDGPLPPGSPAGTCGQQAAATSSQVDAPGHLLCTAKQGTRRICDSQPESNKSSDTRKHGSFRRKADTGMKPQGSAGDTLASYLQKSNVQRTALQYRGNIASTSVDQRTRGVQQRVQQQLQAYRNSTIKEQRPKTTPAGGALRRASSLQYPSAASQAPLDGFPSPRQGKSQGVLHSHRTSSLEETPSCTNPLSESRFTRAANIAPCRSSLHQLEMQQRPATAADPSTVLQQMLKQGGIAHAGDELFPDHSSLAQLLQDFARDVLPSSRSSQTSNTRLSSPRLSQPSKEPQPKAPSSRKTAVHHKEEPEFFGTWKEWCQAEESGRKCKQQCAKSSTTSGTLNRADIGRIATGNPYKYKQQLGVYTGADSRSTMASDGVQAEFRAKKPVVQQRKRVGKKPATESASEKEIVIEVDSALGQAAPHVATITAESIPLSWRLQATLELTMIFAQCTSFTTAERLSENTTSCKLLAAISQMLLEAAITAVVPINLLAMLMCCPAAVRVLIGRTRVQQPFPHQTAHSNASGVHEQESTACHEHKARTTRETCESTASHESKGRSENRESESSGVRVDGSFMHQAVPNVQHEKAKGHRAQLSKGSERLTTFIVSQIQGDCGTRDSVPTSGQGCTHREQHCVHEDDRGVEQLGHTLCGMFRALRSNLLQPAALPLLEVIGAIAREPGGGSWLQRCGISLGVVADTLLQSSGNYEQQVQEAVLSNMRVNLAEIARALLESGSLKPSDDHHTLELLARVCEDPADICAALLTTPVKYATECKRHAVKCKSGA